VKELDMGQQAKCGDRSTPYSMAAFDAASKAASFVEPVASAQPRLGVIVPSVNSVVEPWFAEVLRPHATVHATRMLLADDVTQESLRKMDREEGMAAALRIASCRPQAVAYCCTASSVVQGCEYDLELRQHLQKATGCPSFTAAGALIDALREVGARSISIASPYTDSIDHAEAAFFESAGFRVLRTANLGISDGFGLAAPDAKTMYQLAREAWDPRSDALVVSCLNMNSQRVAGLIESQTQRAVVTSTTATLWKLLKMAGMQIRLGGFGRLLSEH